MSRPAYKLVFALSRPPRKDAEDELGELEKESKGRLIRLVTPDLSDQEGLSVSPISLSRIACPVASQLMSTV